jgi:hypothetical protein
VSGHRRYLQLRGDQLADVAPCHGARLRPVRGRCRFALKADLTRVRSAGERWPLTLFVEIMAS